MAEKEENNKKEFRPLRRPTQVILEEFFSWEKRHAFVQNYPGYPDTQDEAIRAWREMKKQREAELEEEDRRRMEEIYAIMEHEVPDPLPAKKDIRMRKDGLIRGLQSRIKYIPLNGEWLRDDIEFLLEDGNVEQYRWCYTGHFELSERFNKKANSHLCRKCFNEIQKEARNLKKEKSDE